MMDCVLLGLTSFFSEHWFAIDFRRNLFDSKHSGRDSCLGLTVGIPKILLGEFRNRSPDSHAGTKAGGN